MNTPNLVLWESATAGPIAARIAIAGDFLPAGKIELPTGGWGVAATGLAPHFEDVAVAFVNLESVLDAEDLRARPLCGIGDIVSAPSASLDYLKALSAQIVGTANNHSYDFGAAGVERTRRALVHRGLIPLGAGRTLRSAPDVFIWQGPGDLRVGFWAAAKASHDVATRRTEGVEPATIDRARRAIDAIKARGARFAIALLHAGCQRASHPDPADAKLMDRMARSGFDVVAASHSHRISGYRLVRAPQWSPAFCFYGLGSLVSGYAASPARERRTDRRRRVRFERRSRTLRGPADIPGRDRLRRSPFYGGESDDSRTLPAPLGRNRPRFRKTSVLSRGLAGSSAPLFARRARGLSRVRRSRPRPQGEPHARAARLARRSPADRMKATGQIAGAVAFIVAVLLVPVIGKLCHRWDLFDWPGLLKIHSRPIPDLEVSRSLPRWSVECSSQGGDSARPRPFCPFSRLSDSYGWSTHRRFKRAFAGLANRGPTRGRNSALARRLAPARAWKGSARPGRCVSVRRDLCKRVQFPGWG